MINNRFNVVYHLLGLVKLLFYKLELKNMKELKIKIEVVSSEGITTDKKETSVNVVQFTPDSIRKDRILLEIGECLYYVDSDGYIQDQILNYNTGQVTKYGLFGENSKQ